MACRQLERRVGSSPTSRRKSADAVSRMFSASMQQHPLPRLLRLDRQHVARRHQPDAQLISHVARGARWFAPAPAARHSCDARAVMTAQYARVISSLRSARAASPVLARRVALRRLPLSSAPAGGRPCKSATADRRASAHCRECPDRSRALHRRVRHAELFDVIGARVARNAATPAAASPPHAGPRPPCAASSRARARRADG